MASQINASNSGFGGIVSTGDSSGVLQLQTTGTTALTIDTSQNVGIGTASPTNRLHVVGPSGDYRTALFESASGNGPSVQIKGSRIYELRSTNTGAGEGGGLFFIYDKTAEASRITIDSSGRVTTPFQTAFSAYSPSDPGNITTSNTLINRYSSISYNIGSNYNASLSRFTAPIAGIYYFTARAWAPPGASFGSIVIKVNGSQITEQRSPPGSQYTTLIPSVMWQAAAGDYFEVYTGQDVGGVVHTSQGTNYSNFSGYLLG